jgi:hypothetical protein
MCQLTIFSIIYINTKWLNFSASLAPQRKKTKIVSPFVNMRRSGSKPIAWLKQIILGKFY